VLTLKGSVANDPEQTFTRLDFVAESLDKMDLNGNRRGGGG
jgi:hypothetical protein